MSFKRSYLIALIALMSLTVAWSGAGAQSIFLQPNVRYLTTGVGSEFDLELRVDASITSIKLFVYHVDFDPTKLDTVSVTQGPLFPSSGAGTAFGAYIVHDTVLQLEDLIIGAGVAVSGPGLLATVRFKVLDTGTFVLPVIYHRIRDVNGTYLSTQAYGSTIYVNVPPQEFNLLSPIGGQDVSGLPGDQISLSWQASSSVYPGESITYTLQYGTSPTFDFGATTTVTGLTSNSHKIEVSSLTAGYEGPYYWRVTAHGTVNGFERICTPASEHFVFSYTPVPPEPFNLIAPPNGEAISGVSTLLFDWEDALSVIPEDNITYTLFVSTDPAVQTDILVSTPTVASMANLALADMPLNQPLYWLVTAQSKCGMTRPSSSIFTFTIPGCCVGRTGDANGTGEYPDEVTLGDIMLMVDVLFISNDCTKFACPDEADVNQSGGANPPQESCLDYVSLGDIMTLVDFLFITGPDVAVLPNCL